MDDAHTRRSPTTAPGHRAPARSRSGRVDDTAGELSGVIGEAGNLAREWTDRTLTGGRLMLAETRLAAMSFVRMLFLSVAAAILAVSAWGVLASGIVVGAYRAGIPLWLSLSVLGVLHFLAAVLLVWRIRRLSDALDYSHTRRALFGSERDGDEAIDDGGADEGLDAFYREGRST